MLHAASTVVLLLVATGLYFRQRRPEWHLKFMISAFVVDLLLVVYIEVTRHAVETVVSQVRPLLWVHAAISLAVLVCYVVMIGLGRRLLAGQVATRATHRTVGFTFCGLRVLNYVTSFMV